MTRMYVTDLIHAWSVLFLESHSWASPESSFYFFAVLMAWNLERPRRLLSTPGVWAAQASRWMETCWGSGSLPISLVNKRNCVGRLRPFVCRQPTELIFPFTAAKYWGKINICVHQLCHLCLGWRVTLSRMQLVWLSYKIHTGGHQRNTERQKKKPMRDDLLFREWGSSESTESHPFLCREPKCSQSIP